MKENKYLLEISIYVIQGICMFTQMCILFSSYKICIITTYQITLTLASRKESWNHWSIRHWINQLWKEWQRFTEPYIVCLLRCKSNCGSPRQVCIGWSLLGAYFQDDIISLKENHKVAEVAQPWIARVGKSVYPLTSTMKKKACKIMCCGSCWYFFSPDNTNGGRSAHCPNVHGALAGNIIILRVCHCKARLQHINTACSLFPAWYVKLTTSPARWRTKVALLKRFNHYYALIIKYTNYTVGTYERGQTPNQMLPNAVWFGELFQYSQQHKPFVKWKCVCMCSL